jgi:hypothetical protein
LIDKINNTGLDRDYVISDMRFKHELLALRAAFGSSLKVIKVLRNTQFSDSHVSEQEFCCLQSDYIFVNNDTHAKLYEFVDEIVIN